MTAGRSDKKATDDCLVGEQMYEFFATGWEGPVYFDEGVFYLWGGRHARG